MKQKENKKSAVKIVLDQLAGIFCPVINYITAASILKCLLFLLAGCNLISRETGFYKVFNAASEGFFYFLPFFLAINISRLWKTDLFLTLFIPAAMLFPELNAILENSSESISFLGIPVQNAIYHSSVIPVIFASGLLYFVEKPCDRFIPEVIRGFLKPILCLLVVLPFTFLVFGPVGTWIGNGITRLFLAIYTWNPIVSGVFMGALIQPMVSVGAHWSLVPIAMNNLSVIGYDIIFPLFAGAVYAQSGAALACALKFRDPLKKKNAFQSAFTAFLGVTEPALYTVNLPLMKPFICAVIGGGIGGAITGFAGTRCYSFAFPSVVTCLAYAGPGFGLFMFSMVVGFISGFGLTMAVCRKNLED